MRTASEIMKKKNFIKEELDRQMSKAQSDAIWRQAEAKLSEILLQYSDMPKGECLHTDNYIFPAAAIYLVLKESVNAEMAYSVVEKAAIRNSSAAGKKLEKAMHIPFLRSLFIAIWEPMTRKMFGPEQGFQNVFYPKKSGEFRMDVTACPYCRYLTQLGCPELVRIFCANDERVYGNLPGIEFRRAGTLGTGADHCDFYIGKA